MESLNLVPCRAGNSATRNAPRSKRWEMKLPAGSTRAKMLSGSAWERVLEEEMHEGGGWGPMLQDGALWKVCGRSSESQKHASEMLESLLVYVEGN